ncbi:MAG: adenosylmethionine--8-amino-7-oxononanoate transaminase [Planctomycetales bacterium]|nr:adenosylmethionine--8-amino-7-oxononanoate transaminase [Planctomycetales bacterium]
MPRDDATKPRRTYPTPDWQRRGADCVWLPYTQMQNAPTPLPVVATEDVYLITDDGRRLIDGMASWWTACHGYNHPHIRQAVESQLAQMPHVMFGGIHHPQALRLAERLAELTPGDLHYSFFSDSGSVAVEVALKIAVQYERNRGHVGRVKFVTFRDAYHGDTLGAMSVCDPVDGMHANFRGYLLDHYSLPIPKSPVEQLAFEHFLLEHRRELAGVIIEPMVQGAGGMKFHSAQTLAAIRATCERLDILLIADEIATGFGRTGRLFACDHADIVPDILCLGKALTGGTLSMAVTQVRPLVFKAFLSSSGPPGKIQPLMHGPTFMGNPLACAAANASLDLFESEPRVQQASGMEAVLTNGLEPCRNLPGILDVRCRGAIGVIQVSQLKELNWLRQRFIDNGIWLRPFGDIIYVTPPLSISPAQLEQLLTATVKTVREWCERVSVASDGD